MILDNPNGGIPTYLSKVCGIMVGRIKSLKAVRKIIITRTVIVIDILVTRIEILIGEIRIRIMPIMFLHIITQKVKKLPWFIRTVTRKKMCLLIYY